MGDLIDFSGETFVQGYMMFFKAQQLAETRRFVNRMRKEAQIARNLIAQLNALIAEIEVFEDQGEVFDTLIGGEEIEMKEAQLELTEVVESSSFPDKMKVVFDQACSEEKAFASLMKDLSLSLRISVSKKRRLVAELEVLVERGDPARPLEHMGVIVARDSELLGEFEKLLARAQVGVGLKDGYVTDMEEMESVVEDYRLAREINRVTVEVRTTSFNKK
ncbi:hypothetical protein Tco_0097780 [Tanacetum coccineum]